MEKTLEPFSRAPKNETDLEYKGLFTKYLQKRGFEVIEPTNPISFFDLLAVKDNKYYVFELKRRWCDSNKFGDSIVELNKLTNLKKIDYEKNTKSFVVNLFKDCFHIHSIDEMVDIQVHKAPKTTYLEDGSPIIKMFASWKNTNKSKRFYD